MFVGEPTSAKSGGPVGFFFGFRPGSSAAATNDHAAIVNAIRTGDVGDGGHPAVRGQTSVPGGGECCRPKVPGLLPEGDAAWRGSRLAADGRRQRD